MSRSSAMRRAGLALVALLALPPIADWIERSIVSQAALQVPALALAGWLVGASLPERASRLGGWNRDGVPGLLLGAGVFSVWMLPRAMDASLADPLVELAKYVSLPLAAGLPLGLSWRRLGFVARAFVWANALSMLATLGWLYRIAPTRLCSYYLIGDQRRLGDVMLALCVGLGLIGSLRAFAPFAGTTPASMLGEDVRSLSTQRCRTAAPCAPVERHGGTVFERSRDSIG